MRVVMLGSSSISTSKALTLGYGNRSFAELWKTKISEKLAGVLKKGIESGACFSGWGLFGFYWAEGCEADWGEGPSINKAHPLVKRKRGHLSVKRAFHVKPTLKWVKRARVGEAHLTGFDPLVDMGHSSLETGRFSSAQSSGSLVDQPQALTSIIAGSWVWAECWWKSVILWGFRVMFLKRSWWPCLRPLKLTIRSRCWPHGPIFWKNTINN